MKRTTYIMIGVYLGGLLLILIGLVTLRNTMFKERGRYEITLSGETASVDLTDITTVKVKVINPSLTNSAGGNEFNVSSAPEATVGKITYPASEYIKAEKDGSTLILTFDFESACGNNYTIETIITTPRVVLNMEIPKTLTTIEDESWITMSMRGIKTDSLNLTSNTNVMMEDCDIRSLDINNIRRSFTATNSNFQNMYADLDNVDRWNFTDSNISNQYLTGSSSKAKLPLTVKGGRVYWRPKTNNANLALSFDEVADMEIGKW